MNPEKMPEKVMDAISGISDNYIEKYSAIESVKHDRINRLVIQRKWAYRVGSCLAIIAIKKDMK